METTTEIIEVNSQNVQKTGFFCFMSKPKAPGYRQKLAWLEERFAEGMKFKMLHEQGGRNTAFIEYIPGEYAWRTVHAPGYLVIHCLWVVGKGKGKGYGAQLLQECIADARAQGKQGVVMISSDGTWLARKQIFLQNGFEEVDQALPSFQLLVHRFGNTPNPAFPHNWAERQAAFGPGLTVTRTAQCPYIEDASNLFLGFAAGKDIPARSVEFRSAREVQEQAPSPYGAFGVVYNGKLFSYTYLKQVEFEKRLTEEQWN